MGVGEFLSSKATNEWILSEKKREEWYVLHVYFVYVCLLCFAFCVVSLVYFGSHLSQNQNHQHRDDRNS